MSSPKWARTAMKSTLSLILVISFVTSGIGFLNVTPLIPVGLVFVAVSGVVTPTIPILTPFSFIIVDGSKRRFPSLYTFVERIGKFNHPPF